MNPLPAEEQQLRDVASLVYHNMGVGALPWLPPCHDASDPLHAATVNAMSRVAAVAAAPDDKERQFILLQAVHTLRKTWQYNRNGLLTLRALKALPPDQVRHSGTCGSECRAQRIPLWCKIACTHVRCRWRWCATVGSTCWRPRCRLRSLWPARQTGLPCARSS